jgi:hypothetical protein
MSQPTRPHLPVDPDPPDVAINAGCASLRQPSQDVRHCPYRP